MKLNVWLLKKLGMYSKIKRWKDVRIFKKQLSQDYGKLIALYGLFIEQNSIVFDCGAAYGNRSRVFLDLRAGKVVAVEPLTYYNQFLREIPSHQFTFVNAGIGAKEEKKTFYECSSPTLSTFDQEGVEILKKNPQMSNLEWLPPREIEIITLDKLIKEYGKPDFIKLDIEDYEIEALKGLSVPVKAIGFEFHTYHPEKTIACIKKLMKLGHYEFNYSLRESFELSSQKWINEKDMINILKNMDNSIEFGDIYARLK